MASFATHYLQANLLVFVGYTAVRLIQLAGEGVSRRVNYSTLLVLSRLFLLCAVFLPFLSVLLPKQSFLSPSAQVWQSTSMRKADSLKNESIITVGGSKKPATVSTEIVDLTILISALSIALTLIIRFGWASWKLRQEFLKSHRLRRIGQTEIRVADEIVIPFSFGTLSNAYIFLPSHMLGNSEEFMIAVRHEIQHHRQRDTRWSYWCEIFRCVFFLNPFSHLLLTQFSQIQEFACDEALIDHGNVSPHAYGSCLLRVAETARGTHAVLVGTTCMAVSPSGSFLKRRINHMLNVKTKRYLNKSVGALFGIIGVMAMATVTWASQSIVQDRRVTLEEATQFANSVRKNSNFPITVNEAVVKELNRYVGTPDGREFIKNSLARMENYRTLIEGKLDQYGLPRELMAMPIMESGYKNSPQNPYPLYSAGVWQFIPQTARNYGLRVDDTVDERLSVEKSTDAACRYLGALSYQFQNWELAILAYNAGENKVRSGITKTGSKNAWALIDNGFSGDDRYLPKMIAAILILNNPSIIE